MVVLKYLYFAVVSDKIRKETHISLEFEVSLKNNVTYRNDNKYRLLNVTGFEKTLEKVIVSS